MCITAVDESKDASPAATPCLRARPHPKGEDAALPVAFHPRPRSTRPACSLWVEAFDTSKKRVHGKLRNARRSTPGRASLVPCVGRAVVSQRSSLRPRFGICRRWKAFFSYSRHPSLRHGGDQSSSVPSCLVVRIARRWSATPVLRRYWTVYLRRTPPAIPGHRDCWFVLLFLGGVC